MSSKSPDNTESAPHSLSQSSNLVAYESDTDFLQDDDVSDISSFCSSGDDGDCGGTYKSPPPICAHLVTIKCYTMGNGMDCMQLLALANPLIDGSSFSI